MGVSEAVLENADWVNTLAAFWLTDWNSIDYIFWNVEVYLECFTQVNKFLATPGADVSMLSQ